MQEADGRRMLESDLAGGDGTRKNQVYRDKGGGKLAGRRSVVARRQRWNSTGWHNNGREVMERCDAMALAIDKASGWIVQTKLPNSVASTPFSDAQHGRQIKDKEQCVVGLR